MRRVSGNHLYYTIECYFLFLPYRILYHIHRTKGSKSDYYSVFLFLVLTRRAVVTPGAVGGRAAPNALVRAGTMTMLPRGRIIAPRAIRRRPAIFAVLLIIAMLVLTRRAVITPRAIGRRPTISTFRTHTEYYTKALKQITMCSGSCTSQYKRVIVYTIYQQPIRLNMTFTKTGIITGQ